jgi:hypothetical protein
MPFYDFLLKPFQRAVATNRKVVSKSKNNITLPEMMNELGVRTSSVLGTYNQEENPDYNAPDTYIYMQDNDGTVRSIVRIFTMPIVATNLSVIPGENDNGEADFIKTVFFGSERQGGMSTTLPFVIADMCRAIFEGFRLYEKVPQIIQEGKWKGKIGWRKLAPRDSTTLTLRTDENGGFNGAHQLATFGSRYVDVELPAAKCLLYTFQKEKHPLYGESILKTAYYHYDKKHKLYYLAHKKAEIDAVGLKILKVSNANKSGPEITAAEEAIEQIGVNTRITMPQGLDLEIDRSPSGYNVLDLIEHHDNQIRYSALTQATSMGVGQKYAYPYGKGYGSQGAYLSQCLQSIMSSMEDTLNSWAVAPLIDWNFNTSSYPKIQFAPLTDEIQLMLSDIFYILIKKKEYTLPAEFETKLIDSVAKRLGIEYKSPDQTDAFKAFEVAKKSMSDTLKIPCPPLTKKIKERLHKKYIQLKDDPELLEKFEVMGKDYILGLSQSPK